MPVVLLCWWRDGGGWRGRCVGAVVDGYLDGGHRGAGLGPGLAFEGVVARDRGFDLAGADARAAGGQQVLQDRGADLADQLWVLGSDPGGEDDVGAGGLQGGGEAGAVGV